MRMLLDQDFVGIWKRKTGETPLGIYRFRGGLPYSEYVQTLFTYLEENYKFKKILEIGFLYGHSATWFLETFPKAHITSFDILKTGCTIDGITYVNYKLVTAKYGDNRFKFHRDSSIEIPKYYEPGVFDVAFVDGDHTCGGVVNDIETCFKLKIPLLIIDNMELPDQQRAVGFYKDNLKLIKSFVYYTINRDGLTHKRFVNLYDVLSYDI